jgi:hypothetical protein
MVEQIMVRHPRPCTQFDSFLGSAEPSDQSGGRISENLFRRPRGGEGQQCHICSGILPFYVSYVSELIVSGDM